MGGRKRRHHPGPEDRGPSGRGGRRGRRAGGGPAFGRMRRGDVRSALLIALLDGPGHGYELIQALEQKTEGRWRPSPGSVYPTLQLLADEDLVTSIERDGKRIFELTDTGRADAERRVEKDGLPWETDDLGDGYAAFRGAMRDLHLATKQTAMTANPEVVQRATEILVTARKDLYRLLAEN